MPGVKVYPHKEVETGTQIYESLIWESRASSSLFGKDGVSGLVNVDLTPEVVTRLAVALGTALPRGAQVVASREADAACRLVERAMIAGLNSTGVNVADLRVLPSAVGRHLLKKHDYDAGFHVGLSSADQEIVTIHFFEQPGIQLTPAMQKEIEKHYSRQELRRAAAADVGTVDYPVQARESYAADLLATLDAEAIRSRGYRIVVDYGYSAASLVLPLVLGPLGVEAVSAHAFSPAQAGGGDTSLRSLIGQTKKLVAAVGADFGAVFDRSAERLYLIDEQGHEIPVEQTLLLFLRLLGSNGRHGKLAFPVTVTSQVDRIVKKSDLEIIRTPASLSELTKAAAADGVIFAGAVGGRIRLSQLPARLRRDGQPLQPARAPGAGRGAALISGRETFRCRPSSTGSCRARGRRRGLVMRVLTERLKDRKVDLLDGIKVTDRRGWAQVLPDADEPLIHIYAEGSSDEVSNELEEELRSLVEDVLQREVGETEAQISS